MDIDLDGLFKPSEDIFVGRSPAGRGLLVGEVREMLPEDLLELESMPKGSETPALNKLRASHHALAKLLSTGTSNIDASRMLGISQSRISILRNDPSFKDLITHYAGIQEIAFIGMQEKLAQVGADTLEVLHERVLDDSDKIATDVLVKIAEMTLDRTGHGKQSNINVKSLTLSVEDLERIKGVQNENVIQISQADRSALIRQISNQAPAADS